MINTANKQAFLILSNEISKKIIKRYLKLKKATANLGDVFLLYHTDDNRIPIELEGIKIETFTNEILNNLNYKPIRQTLVPGSNHFPVLKFFIKYPHYTHYWCIEDDVAFSGNWIDFFENVSPKLEYDFITSHIRRYSDIPNWFWWNTFNSPGGKFNTQHLLKCFNPIYRISNKALHFIDACLKGEYSGHHEVLLPSLLYEAGFKIADFSAQDNQVTPGLSYCTLRTMRWKPVFFMAGNKKNKLYHPVKVKVTFKEILFYIKKVVRNPKKYLT